ncbi:MAG: outer membrane beta-barrel protein [Dysgonomonas sp.]|nr:outer membrane beta-barrel protein [Dysgonomonas sp.]
MKKILLFAVLIAASFSLSAQTTSQFRSPQASDFAVVGSVGYQTNFERFGIAAQGRYNLMRNIRIAPDIAFYFPKDKVTGLDVMLNAHYVFYFPQDRFSVYPLAGFGMQNNFYGKQTVVIDGDEVKTDSHSSTDFAFNLGGGISYQISPNGFLNAEVKFMLGDNDNAAIMLGYGYRF